jgi:hypothetical protein
MPQRQRLRSLRLDYSDHNRREDVGKDFSIDLGTGPFNRLRAWFYEVHYNCAMEWAQYAFCNFDDSREVCRIANLSDVLRPMPMVRPEIHCSPERVCQRFGASAAEGPSGRSSSCAACHRGGNLTCMRIPITVGARDHDEGLALRRSLDPQRQPEIRAFADRYRVPMFTRNGFELHLASFFLASCRSSRPIPAGIGPTRGSSAPG